MTSTLDPDSFARQRKGPKGHDVKSLGPSDSTDSGSDVASGGTAGTADTSDRYGTGEHGAADDDENPREGADVATDRIVGAGEAGLGDGLDQAEEAQLGITDEELEGDPQDDRIPSPRPRLA